MPAADSLTTGAFASSRQVGVPLLQAFLDYKAAGSWVTLGHVNAVWRDALGRRQVFVCHIREGKLVRALSKRPYDVEVDECRLPPGVDDYHAVVLAGC